MKIVYGVAGEGFGHSSRSHLIGQRLIDSGHEVKFVASDKSYLYLKQYFGDDVKKIKGMFLVYSKRYLSTFKTFLYNSGQFPGSAINNYKLFSEYIEPFNPDLVISDFEPFTAFWASWNNVPLLSIDHQHLLTNCEIEDFQTSKFAKFSSHLVIKCYRIKADAHLILNFFHAKVKNDSSILVPPVVRSIVKKFEPTAGEHIICYSTDNTDLQKLLSVFHKFPKQKFVIYGFNHDSEYKNCSIRRTSTREFLKDLSSSKAVIATAGFSLLSECLYFRKKMLLLPILGQYEQLVNAHYIQKLKLGNSSPFLNESVLEKFLSQSNEHVKDSEEILWPDNDRFFEIFDNTLNKLCNSSRKETFVETAIT